MVHDPAPDAGARRRYYAMDRLMPTTLSIEATYYEWLEFRKGYMEWTKACYKMAGSPIVYTEYTRTLTMRIDQE